MVKSCCDSYHTQFSDFSAMLSYHEQVRKSSLWERTEVKKLQEEYGFEYTVEFVQ